MFKVEVVVDIDGETNACTDGKLLVAVMATARPANAAATAVGRRLTIVLQLYYYVPVLLVHVM